MSKQDAHDAFNVIHAYSMTWTSHKTFCERLRAEVRGDLNLPDCTCGYFEATKQLDEKLTTIRNRG